MNTQPPVPGQPFQPPPVPGQPFQPQYQAPAAYGPPPSATSGRSALWPVAVAVLAVAVLAASFWLGTYLAVYGRSGINFYLLLALVGATVGGLVAVSADTATQVRTWGSDLFGKTALGWRRVDLAHLTSASIAGTRGNSSIVLGDSQGRITFSAKKLGPVIESVRRGVAEGAQQGRLAVPTELAAILGLPAQQGARKRGSTSTLAFLGVAALIAIGVIIGMVIAS